MRANNKGIVPSNDPTALKALDHDFHVGNIIPSVTLLCNIPDDITVSFFIGGKDGTGQIHVTLRDSVFDPSKIIDHCAQLIATLRLQGLKPTVLVVQTDGGPDHSLKRVAVQLAMVGTFRELDLDHMVIIRCAPNDSASNVVERSMSVLNLPLAHASLKRAEMPDWAEGEVKNCSSMKAVRDKSDKRLTSARQKL